MTAWRQARSLAGGKCLEKLVIIYYRFLAVKGLVKIFYRDFAGLFDDFGFCHLLKFR